MGHQRKKLISLAKRLLNHNLNGSTDQADQIMIKKVNDYLVRSTRPLCRHAYVVSRNGAKKILNYCQLDWNDEVLSFFKNKRRVITVSTVQVRENIYKSSINSWLNYKNDLEKYFKKLV